jgi:hypothetical protein
MGTALENPVRVPELGAERLAQMRAHLLGELEAGLERDARKRKRHARLRSLVSGRRRMLAIVAVVLAGIYAVPAVAQERWWWVFSPDDSLQPVTQVVNVGRWTERQLRFEGSVPTTRFAVDGRQWLMQAFVNQRGHLCVGISANPPWPPSEPVGFISCGHPIHGIPPTSPRRKEVEVHWVGFGTAIAGKVESARTKIHVGPAAENVRSIDLENDDGRVVRVPTIAAPKELGVPARFWIAVLPIEHLVHTLVPRDEDGKALERWGLPIAQ